MVMRRGWEQLDEYEREWVMERAGIREFDGGATRGSAYYLALEDFYANEVVKAKAAKAARAGAAGSGPRRQEGLVFVEDGMDF
jgi:hypothetical protein